VVISGRWLPERTVFLDNRPMDGRVGFFVVTPLVLADEATTVLVQRGWLPRNSAERSQLPPLHTPAGMVTVQGRVAASPSRLYELGAAARGPIRQNLDLAEFAAEMGRSLLPLAVIEATPDGAPDGLLRHWSAPDLGLQKHYGYAFQWFALSALILGLYVWFQLLRPHWHRRRLT